MTKTNLQADIATRARQIAVGELKQKLRDTGKRHHEIFTTDVRSGIAGYLREHPEIVERAANEVAQWRKKGLLKRVRETPDFIELLRR